MSTPPATTEQLVHALIQQVAALTASLQNSSPSHSSMNKPDPFKGQSSIEAQQFLAHFTSWATEQPDLKNDEARCIKVALGFFSGTAGDWATPYLDSFNRGTNPFNGAWNSFVDAFKLRFESIDPGMEAREAIKGLKQSKGQSVAEYSQVFKDIGDRSGLSDIDLRERFHSGLLPVIRQNLIIVNIAQGLAKSLDEAIKCAVLVDTYLHDPTMTNRHSSRSQTSTSHTSDPYSMDIDASCTGNGNTRDSFIAHMRGRCYGCGSQSHEKQSCPHKDTTCHYCAQRGHLESVCQDKFMGLE